MVMTLCNAPAFCHKQCMRIIPALPPLLLFLLPAGLKSAPVTFNQDIAPIIFHNCSSCHRSGEAAPFPLLSYLDVKKKAKTLVKATSSRLMPPWKAEPASYAYRDERRLKDSEIALIDAWVKGGMEEGTGEKPVPPPFESGWALGEPDLVVEMPAAYHVPADGPDIYRNLVVPLGLKEDKWVTAIDMKPTARAAVHHVLYFADPKGRLHEKPQQGTEPGFRGMRPAGANVALGGFALGAQPGRFPDGFAMKLPKGSDFVVQYHFHPTGKPETEKALIGFYFTKQEPERKMVRLQMPPHYSLFSGLDIPAGEKDFVIRDSYTLPVAVDALGLGAHAHYIGKRMKMTATLPSGEVKTLLSISDWDFAWQGRYYFQDLVALPQGTKLDTEIHWDNSADNLRNPSSPPARVTWGEESKDEMGSVSLITVAHEEKDRPTLQRDHTQHQNEVVQAGLKADPTLGPKIRQLLAE
jgi:mono/diheme cytochrome c family protein